MRMSTGAVVDVFREKLCIALMLLILFYELAGRDYLVDGAGLVIGIEEETISKLCLTS